MKKSETVDESLFKAQRMLSPHLNRDKKIHPELVEYAKAHLTDRRGYTIYSDAYGTVPVTNTDNIFYQLDSYRRALTIIQEHINVYVKFVAAHKRVDARLNRLNKMSSQFTTALKKFQDTCDAWDRDKRYGVR